MSINQALPVPGLVNEKLTLSADLQTVLYAGQEVSTEHFVKVTVPALLGFYPKGSASAFALLSEMDANGFNIKGYGNHTTHWAQTIVGQREDHERRKREAEQHRERMEALHASPEEIAKFVAERKQRQADIANRFGDRGKMAHFGG